MSPRAIIVSFLPLVLLLCCCYEGEGKALFGLGSLLGTLTSSDTNGTSILAALALAHAQHTINKLEQLAELFALGQNVTASFLTN